MNIINKINHKYLGEICCIADENRNPLKWCKMENVNIFSINSQKVEISLDFFCFNKDFKSGEAFDDIRDNLEQNIFNAYKTFLNDRSEIEKAFFNCFKNEIEPHLESDEFIECIEKIYFEIKVAEVRIYADGYAVIIDTPWFEESLAVEKRGLLEEEQFINISMESDIDGVEMNYNNSL